MDVTDGAPWDYAGFALILLSWAVLPGIVVWWEATRRRLARVLLCPATAKPASARFMPVAPALSAGVFVLGLIPTVVTLGSRVSGNLAVELGFFSLAVWGLVSMFASVILWTHLHE